MFLYFSIILLICLKKIEFNIIDDRTKPIDFELKPFDECFLTIHNFISINSSNQTGSSLKTYIYTATKPFLLEILNNSTNDCLCCPEDVQEIFQKL